MKGITSLGSLVTFIILITLATFILLGSRDPSHPFPADLEVIRPELQEDENAFTSYEAIPHHLYWPKHSGNTIMNDSMEGLPVDDAELLEILETNKAVFDAIEAGLKREICLAPEIIGVNDLLPHIQPWMQSAKLMGIATRYYRRTGNVNKATDFGVNLIDFSTHIQQTPECTLHYLVGIAILQIANRNARELAFDPHSQIKDLERLSHSLEKQGSLYPGFKRAMQTEYRYQANMLDELNSGNSGIADYIGFNDDETVRMALRATGIQGYTFHVHKTKRKVANIYCAIITNAHRNYSDTVPIPELDSLMQNISFRHVLKPNGGGEILLRLLMPAVESLTERHILSECDTRGTRIVLAMRRYFLEHGTLPESPDILIPDYLKTWPLDPFDGNPFRYSKDKKTIYAVGADLKDNGGSEIIPPQKPQRSYFHQQWNAPDVVFPVCPKHKSQAKPEAP
jgi:hypothetical protein